MGTSENGAAADRRLLNAGKTGGPSDFFRCRGFFSENSPCLRRNRPARRAALQNQMAAGLAGGHGYVRAKADCAVVGQFEIGA